MATRPDGIDIADAAVQLGLTPDGVRKRIQRGKIRGYKAGGRWYVQADSLSAVLDENSTPRQADKVDRAAESVWTTRQPKADKQSGAVSRLIEALERENQFLKQELDRRADEILRRDQIIAALAQWLPALQAAEVYDVSSPVGQQANGTVTQHQTESSELPTRRPWWKIWTHAK
jgi:predicted ArsR family transcriptional regulator